MLHRLSRFHRRYPSLATLGFAVQPFPGYVNRRVNLHALEVVLLSVIVRGHGEHRIENEVFEEHGNSVAVTHYGQRHDILTDRRGMDVINVYLDLKTHALPVLPRELNEVLPLFLPLHPRFVHRLNRIVRIQFDDLKPLTDQLFAIQRELNERKPGHEEAARMHFQLFLIHCCRRALEKGFVREQARSSPHASLEQLRHYLDHHYAEHHTLETLAQRVRLSRTSLCRAFKAYTGKRVFDYLIERRIQAAMMHLRGTDQKVLNVALESGFRDLAYFNRKFKRLVGLTPSGYRKQLAGSN